MKLEYWAGFHYVSSLPVGPSHKDEHTDAVPTSDRDSPTLTGREESEEPGEKGDDSLTDEREEDDARSSCFSRKDSCDTGEAESKVITDPFKKVTHFIGHSSLLRMR